MLALGLGSCVVCLMRFVPCILRLATRVLKAFGFAQQLRDNPQRFEAIQAHRPTVRRRKDGLVRASGYLGRH